MRNTVAVFILLVISLNLPAQKIEIKTSPEEVGNKIVDNIVKRRFGWRYQKVCSYYGALIFADATNNKNIVKQIEDGYAPYLKGKRKPHKGHVDYNVFGIWPLELYRQTENPEYLKTGIFLANHEFEHPRKDGLTEFTRFWVDDMYMVGALQVQAFKTDYELKYLNRAALQLKTYCDSLQRPNGLFYHREDAPFFWGRGNGWAAAALTEILLVLPRNHKFYYPLLGAYQKMMNTLISYQGEDGMWHQLLDDPESFPETSCTGMFLYALATGIDRGWLPFEDHQDNVIKGWDALASYVNEKGKTENVCVGTNAKPRKKHYLNRPRSTGNFHGQAAVLWAATALVRLQKKL